MAASNAGSTSSIESRMTNVDRDGSGEHKTLDRLSRGVGILVEVLIDVDDDQSGQLSGGGDCPGVGLQRGGAVHVHASHR